MKMYLPFGDWARRRTQTIRKDINRRSFYGALVRGSKENKG